MGNIGDKRHCSNPTVEVIVLQGRAFIAERKKHIADLKAEIDQIRDSFILQKEAEIKRYELDIKEIETKMENIPVSNIKQIASEVVDADVIQITTGGE